MNFNGQTRVVNHLINVLSDPSVRTAERQRLAEVRRLRARDATIAQPFYFPMTFSMTAAANDLPYRQYTPNLSYDVIIIGAKTNCWPGFGRKIVVSKADGQENFVRNGNDSAIFLRTDDIAGSTVAAGGNPNGVFYWTQPFLLKQNESLSVEMIKQDLTSEIEVVNLTFIAIRVYPQLQQRITIDENESALIDRLIALRETPLSKYMKVGITFPSDDVGATATNIYTPQNDEPMILRGVRTNLSNCTLSLGLEGGPNWMADQTPIWAIGAENESQVDNYLWGERGIYVHSNQSIVINSMINGNIDQQNVDVATGGEITFLYDTV